MIQKKWASVPPQSFTADGDAEGNIKVPNTNLFKVQQTVTIFSDNHAPLQLEVKRISSIVDMKLGPKGKPIHEGVNLTAFLVSDDAMVSAEEQDRPAIPPDAYNRAVYDEEPTVAIRNVLVDQQGRKYTSSNPFPVQLSDGSINIGTVNADLDVQLTDKESGPGEDDYDITRIGDGVDQLQINPDGSLNVNVTPSNTSSRIESEYNEASSVPSLTPTLLCSFTAPVGKLSFLHKVFVSGENVAKYQVKLNGVTIDTKRTYFSGEFDCVFDFSDSIRGKLLSVGDVVEVFVEHNRPDVGDFNARIQSVQI